MLWLCVAQGPAPTYMGDLPAIKKRGVLRVLIDSDSGQLVRGPDPLAAERALVEDFVKRVGLRLEWVPVSRGDAYLELLERGQGDIAVASLTPTAERRERALFTKPLRFVKQLVVVGKNSPIHALEDLAAHRLRVRPTSAHAARLSALKLPFAEAPEETETLDLLAAVARGELEGTVADSDLVSAAQTFMPELAAPFAISDKDPIAWAVRKDSPQLKAALDDFLVEDALTAAADLAYTVDLAGIKQRKVLRILTRNASHCYYLHRGVEVGFEHDLALLFAKALGVRLQVIVAPSREALLAGLAAGKGDLVAAGLTPTEGRRQSYAFSQPYLETEQVLVVPKSDQKTQSLADLKGRTIWVRRSSSYYEALAPKAAELGFRLGEVPEEQEAEEILRRVANGEVEATVIDRHLAEIERAISGGSSPALRVVTAVGPKEGVSWALRKDQPELLAAVDAFLKKGKNGLEFNLLRQRYFESRAGMRASASDGRADVSGKLGPFDALAKKFARQYELDWRLLTAQMYQESRFDPAAKSWVGAEGLMQVMPATAKDLGFRSVREPEPGIHAGAKLMAQYAGMFVEPEVKEKDRLRFALAAYNAGPGHVFDARRLAKELGLDANRWFENVEVAMSKLAEPKYASRARYGYCRASEPIQYVSQIQTRYEAYANVMPP
ncbi:MAG: transporter substrate-binding domain-containing protein [Myxococcota bacterium]